MINITATSKLYKCHGRKLEIVSYQELADFAMNGAEYDGIAEFLECPMVFEASDADEALHHFQKYLEMEID